MFRSKKVRRSRRVRILYRWLAFSMAGFGAIGVVLPLIPTTPFLLVAVWAADRSSPTLHRKIRNNRHFAPVIHAWENGRAIPTRAKVVGCSLLALSLINLWWFGAPTPLLIGMALFFTVITSLMLSRPSPQAVARKLAAAQAAEQPVEQQAVAENPLSQQQRPVQTENEQQRQAASQ